MRVTTSIRPGKWCIRRPAVMSTGSVPRSAAMAASAFQSTTVERARITVASPTGIELARMAGSLCHPVGARLRRRPQSFQAELDRASSEQATPASGQDQRLTRSDSDKGAAIIPIDAQPLGTKGFGRAARAVRQRGLSTLLHWPDPQRAAGAAAPLRRVSSRWNATQRNLGPGWFKNRATQSLHDVAGSRPSPMRFMKAALWPTCPLKCI
jgi:hypothetical protein